MTSSINQGITHQLRRGTSTQMPAFTGAQGEPSYNTSVNRLIIHDGATAGGWPVESAAVQVFLAGGTFTGTINNTAAMAYIYSSSAATVTLTLPSVVNYGLGQRLTLVDAQASGVTVTVVAASSTESIFSTAGVASTSFTFGGTPGQIARIIGTSTSKWVGLHKV